MTVKPIKTRALNPPQDDLMPIIRETITELPEKSILAISSKVVAIDQGRCIRVDQVPDKDELIKREAGRYLTRDYVPNQWVMMTITDGTLIPTAGIDESNANDHYILMPKDSDAYAKQLWQRLKKEYQVNDLGIIITDSRTTPMRWGVSGISLGYYGFDPLNDYKGTPDIFGRTMKISMANIVDSLAVSAVMVMGEGKETQPLALITDLDKVSFEENDEHRDLLKVDAQEDLYAPLIQAVPWEKGGGK